MFRRTCWLIAAILLPLLLLGGIGQVKGMVRETAVAPTHFGDPNRQDETTSSETILIEAVHYAGYEGADDEAVSLINISESPVDVSSWQLTDGVSTAVLPAGLSISPGQIIWLANDAAAFQRQFGHLPNAAKDIVTFTLPALTGTWPGFANDGDEVLLSDSTAQLIDVLVYEDGDTSVTGWSGTAVEPYAPHNALPATGQIIYRMRNQ